MNGINLVIFCAVDYEHLLKQCLESAELFIQDKIISITVISNGKVNTKHKLILDQDFWKVIDPKFEYGNIYKHNWVKQQILKLNLDRVINGNILVCDVEVRFNEPLQWTQKKKFNIFTKSRPMGTSPKFVKDALDIVPTVGFVTEAMLFSSDILFSLRNHLEKKFACNQLALYRNLVYDNPISEKPNLRVFMSEYELYGNYVLKYYPERVLNLQKHCTSKYYSVISDVQTMDKQSNTQWINFYYQVKDPTWPDCYKAKDFKNLPLHIQNECIHVYGYKPNDQ